MIYKQTLVCRTQKVDTENKFFDVNIFHSGHAIGGLIFFSSLYQT